MVKWCNFGKFISRDRIAEHGVRFRFFGDLTQLPHDLQTLIARVELITEQYNKFAVFIHVSVLDA